MAQTPDFTWYSMSPADLLKFLDGQTQNVTSQYKLPQFNVKYSFYNNDITPPADTYVYVRKLPSGVEEAPKSKPFTPSEQNAAKTFFNFISKIANINFTESAPGTGDLNLSHVNTSVLGYANFPATGQSFYITDAAVENSQFLSTLWHEGEHGIGLKHPRNYSGDLSDPAPFMNAAIDSELFTNVSYNKLYYDTDSRNGTGIEINSLSPLDYAAIIKMYGISADAGGVTYRFVNSWDDAFSTYEQTVFSFPVSKTDFAWGYGTKGFDIVDLSFYKSSTYLWLDGKNGIVGVEAPANQKIVWRNFINFDTTEAVDTTLQNIGNIRFYPEDGKTSFGIEKVILPNYNNKIKLGAFFPEIDGGAGDESFEGFYTSKLIDGGAGANTWAIDGKYSDYAKSSNAAFFTLTDKTGATVNYKNIGKIIFSDGQLDTEISPANNHLTAYRLYDAVFDRTPDAEGLGYWIAQSDHGMSSLDIARIFAASPEFLMHYGRSIDDATFVTNLYKNALERAPDAAGKEYWIQQLKNGLSREATIIQFADSIENQQQIAGQIQNGIQYKEWDGLA